MPDPIFVNGFARGGTDILMNLILSDPTAAAVSGELHAVFYGDRMSREKLRKRVLYGVPLRFLVGPEYFDRFNYAPRRSIPRSAAAFIRWVLSREKQRALGQGENMWRQPGERYSPEEIKQARPVAKGIDALVFTNDGLRHAYPGARFVAITRHGFAVAESLMRRGWSLDRAIHHYNQIGREIYKQSGKPDFLTLQYEQIVADPYAAIAAIDHHCGLAIADQSFIRQQHKEVAQKGSVQSKLAGDFRRQLVWYPNNEIEKHFVRDVNQAQIHRLQEGNRIKLANGIGETLNLLGYSKNLT